MSEQPERSAQVAHVLHGVRQADADELSCVVCGIVLCPTCLIQYTFDDYCRPCYRREEDNAYERQNEVWERERERVNDAYNQPSPTWKYWKHT